MVLEGCSDELKEHFLEKTLPSLTCEDFQDIGSSFQEAHGRTQRSGRQSFTSLSSEESNDWDAPFAGHLQERTQQWGKI